MKKVLFTATVDSHILHFHIPYLKMLKENGYEVHVATNGKKEIEYCDKKYTIPFERNPIKTNNLKAYKELKKIINENEYEFIHCHTPVGGIQTFILYTMNLVCEFIIISILIELFTKKEKTKNLILKER